MINAGGLFFLVSLFTFCCCATTQVHPDRAGGRGWWPGGSRWQDAAVNAATHPGTWVPAAGGVLVAAGNWDGDISDWAMDEGPLFGSRKRAEEASDVLRTATHVGMVVTALAVPKEDGWLVSTAWRMAWEHLGVMAASYATDPIKRWTARQRPNGGPGSFPSWHATRAAAYAGMGYRNLDLIGGNPGWRLPARLALASLAAGTAWARVEAGQHYPSDVLAGAALGNFIAVLIHDAFLDQDEMSEISLRVWIGQYPGLSFSVRM